MERDKLEQNDQKQQLRDETNTVKNGYKSVEQLLEQKSLRIEASNQALKPNLVEATVRFTIAFATILEYPRRAQE